VSSADTDLGVGTVTTLSLSSDDVPPTDDEMRTLRRVSGSVSWSGYMLCFVEAANNASYFGVTGVFANFLQRPLPEGGNGWVSIPVDRSCRCERQLTHPREHQRKGHSSLQVLLTLAYRLLKLSQFSSRSSPTAHLSWAAILPMQSLVGTKPAGTA
jgi:hypothetical protein